jgi:lysophospholipase L1-like esterase
MRYLPKAARATGALAIALVSMTTTSVSAFGADAEATNYAALGDSYASGVGTREYFEDSGDCLRSPKAYPQLWAESHSASSFKFAACSGAKTDDLNSKQLGSLSSSTSLVTVSIGGNDVGFSSVIQDCLFGDDSGCDNAVSEAEKKARNELPSKLESTYSKIASAAPNAKVVVLGYPRVNSLGDCGVPGYTETKRKRINAAADVLAEVISESASSAGFTFADTRDAFDGHGVCASSEWINGPSNPTRESFHPKTTGHSEGYLPTLNAVTG